MLLLLLLALQKVLVVIPASDSDAKLSELRAVTKYLRKEEIVDLQLELGKQENARLKT